MRGRFPCPGGTRRHAGPRRRWARVCAGPGGGGSREPPPQGSLSPRTGGPDRRVLRKPPFFAISPGGKGLPPRVDARHDQGVVRALVASAPLLLAAVLGIPRA